jgi:hypothetical protein
MARSPKSRSVKPPAHPREELAELVASLAKEDNDFLIFLESNEPEIFTQLIKAIPEVSGRAMLAESGGPIDKPIDASRWLLRIYLNGFLAGRRAKIEAAHRT